MGMTIAEKIIARAAGVTAVKAGEIHRGQLGAVIEHEAEVLAARNSAVKGDRGDFGAILLPGPSGIPLAVL